MKLLLRPEVTAAGLSFVCCLPLMGPFVSPAHKWMYHDSGAPASIVLAVVYSMIVISLLFTLLLRIARRPGRMRVWLWCGIVFLTPWVLMKDVVLLSNWALPHRLSLAILLVSCLCWIVLAALWRPALVPWFNRIQPFIATMFGFAGMCAVLAIAQMSWYLLAERPMQLQGVLHISAPQAVEVRAQKPRIIWIILDELSYQQVYGHRFPSLGLPAFDQLASQSTVFTHVVPAAEYTEDAVPSLMTGLAVDDIRVGDDATLRSLHDPATGRWQPFHAQDTVFHDAIGDGYRTAVAGWFNPYCRILPKVLDHCKWVFREGAGYGMFSDASIVSNMEAPWIYLADKLRLRGYGDMAISKAANQGQIADYGEISSAGDRFLQDSSIDFLLLHVPVPHPGGVYDRRARAFTTHGASYIDNLALADIYLAHVHELLERRGEWDSSAVVVMGDHSWRTKLLWENSPYWTAEDQVASHGGQFDDRPAYIVKLPHQTTAARVDSRFAAARTRELLDGILDGSIRSVPELADFAQAPAATRYPLRAESR